MLESLSVALLPFTLTFVPHSPSPLPCGPIVLERKRRNELKHCYTELRINVPGICEDERTPTGHILQQATEYIHQLQAEEAELLAALEAEKQRGARLRDELATALSR